MIHRIEAGWVQINDVLSRQERRPRRRLKRFREPVREVEPVRRDVREEEEMAAIDLVV